MAHYKGKVLIVLNKKEPRGKSDRQEHYPSSPMLPSSKDAHSPHSLGSQALCSYLLAPTSPSENPPATIRLYHN